MRLQPRYPIIWPRSKKNRSDRPVWYSLGSGARPPSSLGIPTGSLSEGANIASQVVGARAGTLAPATASDDPPSLPQPEVYRPEGPRSGVLRAARPRYPRAGYPPPEAPPRGSPPAQDPRLLEPDLRLGQVAALRRELPPPGAVVRGLRPTESPRAGEAARSRRGLVAGRSGLVLEPAGRVGSGMRPVPRSPDGGAPAV